MNVLDVYVDGACHNAPNRNQMGIGVVIFFEGEEYRSFSTYEGEGTNNVAEYIALCRGLIEGNKMAKIFKENKIKISKIIINSDSQIIVNTYNGDWKCRQPNLEKYLKMCLDVVLSFPVEVKWIPRAKNKRADVLSKEEITRLGFRG